jgi:hypothetical protein
VKLTTHLRLVPMLRVRGSAPPLLKHRGGSTIYINHEQLLNGRTYIRNEASIKYNTRLYNVNIYYIHKSFVRVKYISPSSRNMGLP